MSDLAPPAPPGAPARRRFSWPMRIFLPVLLFDIAFRSLTVAVPWADWGREMDMRLRPGPAPPPGSCPPGSASGTSRCAPSGWR
jgi:hypothetical protein